MLFLYILFGVYLAAVNLYAFLLVKERKKRVTERGEEEKNINARLLIAGFLGGAIAAYAAMFVYKYKTDNVLMMILLPLLGAVNIYLAYALIKSGFLFFA